MALTTDTTAKATGTQQGGGFAEYLVGLNQTIVAIRDSWRTPSPQITSTTAPNSVGGVTKQQRQNRLAMQRGIAPEVIWAGLGVAGLALVLVLKRK